MEQSGIEIVKKKRPVFLTVLCICTFIWSGAMSLFFLAGMLISGKVAEMISENLGGVAAVISGYIILFMGGFFILWFLSLFGAIKMFRMKKSGYIFYIIPNSIMLVMQALIIHYLPMVHWFIYLYTVTSVLFILLYAFNLRKM